MFRDYYHGLLGERARQHQERAKPLRSSLLRDFRGLPNVPGWRILANTGADAICRELTLLRGSKQADMNQDLRFLKRR